METKWRSTTRRTLVVQCVAREKTSNMSFHAIPQRLDKQGLSACFLMQLFKSQADKEWMFILYKQDSFQEWWTVLWVVVLYCQWMLHFTWCDTSWKFSPSKRRLICIHVPDKVRPLTSISRSTKQCSYKKMQPMHIDVNKQILSLHLMWKMAATIWRSRNQALHGTTKAERDFIKKK